MSDSALTWATVEQHLSVTHLRSEWFSNTMKTISLIIKYILTALTLIIIALNMLYIILNINTDNIWHALGMTCGLCARVVGLVAVVRRKRVLLLLYALFLIFITVYVNELNFQTLIHALTVFLSVIFICLIHRSKSTSVSPPVSAPIAVEPTAPPIFYPQEAPPPYSATKY